MGSHTAVPGPRKKVLGKVQGNLRALHMNQSSSAFAPNSESTLPFSSQPVEEEEVTHRP